jgi:1-deoxy-D-xylulose-5-phosphate reductoisomerase
MVEYIDGSVIAQMSTQDMRLAIMYALTYPERREGVIKPIDLIKTNRLEFYDVDLEKFKAFSLALRAGKEGGTMPACMNAANEVAVKNFLDKKISFTKIPYYVEEAMKKHATIKEPTLEDILKTDLKTRQTTLEMING